MSPQNSMSLDYEPIEQTQSAEDILETQSIECVLETETQEEPPKTQESVSNLDIFFTGDLTSDDDEEPCSMAECTGCTLFFWGKERFCVTCRYYAQYE